MAAVVTVPWKTYAAAGAVLALAGQDVRVAGIGVAPAQVDEQFADRPAGEGPAEAIVLPRRTTRSNCRPS
jgi:hypothetical protein